MATQTVSPQITTKTELALARLATVEETHKQLSTLVDSQKVESVSLQNHLTELKNEEELLTKTLSELQGEIAKQEGILKDSTKKADEIADKVLLAEGGLNTLNGKIEEARAKLDKLVQSKVQSQKEVHAQIELETQAREKAERIQTLLTQISQI